MSQRYVLDNPHMRVRVDTVQLPNGSVIDDYYVWDNPDGVIIVALRPDGRVPAVRQYKHGVGTVVLEFPSGAIDPGETAEAAARRELLEETGYVADSWERLTTVAAFPSKETCRGHIFLARGARKVAEPTLELTEGIVVEELTLDEFAAYALRTELTAAAMVAALFVVQEHFARNP